LIAKLDRLSRDAHFLRGHLTEVGVIAPQGPRCARELAELIEACDETIPFEVCEALAPLVVQLRNLDEAIARLDRIIAKLAQKDETARRLMSIPGFGPITASAMAATIQDASSFAGPREFAAFLGLTPKQNSSGGKPKLGRISKMGNRYLRKLLVVGAHAVLFHRKPHTDPLRTWAKKLIDKKPFKLVAVATRWRASPSQSCAARRSIEKSQRNVSAGFAAKAHYKPWRHRSRG
jgi:transposase